MTDFTRPHFTAIQPFNRTSQFWALSDFRMKEILENHFKIIAKHQGRLAIETVYCLGTSEAEFVQIVDFLPEDSVLFHEFINDLAKVNSPFLEFQDVVLGIAEIKNYPAVFGVKNLEEEVAPEIRNKFEKRDNSYIAGPQITREDMEKEEKFLRSKGYQGPVYEYPIDKYGWEAFSHLIRPKIRRFANDPRVVSVQYLSHTPEWWTLPDHERARVVLEHKTLLKKYVKHVDRNTVQLLGTAPYQFASLFEFPFENIAIYHQMLNDMMRIDAPFIRFNKVFTGLSGIGDYWLGELKDIDIRDVPMTEFSKSTWGYRA